MQMLKEYKAIFQITICQQSLQFDEWMKFFERHKVPKLTPDKLNSPTSIFKTEIRVKISLAPPSLQNNPRPR